MLTGRTALRVHDKAPLTIAMRGETPLYGFAKPVVLGAQNFGAVASVSLKARGRLAVRRVCCKALVGTRRAQRIEPEQRHGRVAGHQVDRRHGPEPPEAAALKGPSG